MMKSRSVLLLNSSPACGLSNTLRLILESTFKAGVRLHQESILKGDPTGSWSNLLPELVSRAEPAMIFFVSPWDFLKYARSLFDSLRREATEPPVVVVSDSEEPDEIYEIIKLGAADYITPPLRAINILPRVWRLLEQSVLPDSLKENLGLNQLIGESRAFLTEINKIPLVAECNASVLISGETGTGKELCARAIHQLSPRVKGRFIPVNCGAIPGELVENELFGHERGAYTGATASQPGLIQEAEGGTLFLDEIDSLPLMAQVKLLRFLQEREYRPLGSTKTRQANLRIVTATNVNVEEAVRDGKLRQDLYYRLNMIPLILPPLRERREDIKPLVAHFLAKYNLEFKKRVSGFSPDATQKLLLHDWPGNVRELEHVIGRAIALSTQSVIRSSDLAISSKTTGKERESFQRAKAEAVRRFERTYLQGLLLAHQGNITKAAQAAQKDRGAFWQLIRKHQIDVQPYRSG